MQHQPSNIEAERSILGSCLIDQDAIHRARQANLEPGQFYNESHGRIFEAMIGLAKRMQPLDLLTVQSALGSDLETIGGLPYLVGLIQGTPTSVYVQVYVERVQQAAKRREIIGVAQHMAATAYAHNGTIEELFTDVSSQFFGAVNTAGDKSHLYGNDDAILNYIECQAKRRERLEMNPEARIQTGYLDIDAMVDELEPGYIMMVGAPTSVGKTVFLENLAEFNAKRGHAVCFYHLELTHESMLHRRMCRQSGVSMKQLRAGYDGPEVSATIDRIRHWAKNVTYVHCPGWTADRIAADITREHMAGRCDIAIVDYLTMISMPYSQGSNDAARIGSAMATLKVLTEQLEIPMVIASQTKRTSDGATEVHKEDLRGSGEIEERANQIVMLNRTKERQAGDTSEVVRVSIEKNSSGPCGDCQLVHQLGRFLYLDYADEEWS